MSTTGEQSAVVTAIGTPLAVVIAPSATAPAPAPGSATTTRSVPVHLSQPRPRRIHDVRTPLPQVIGVDLW
ncbi:MAG: hypothetical protein R2710_15510 [Acidimicrobiales bacterium]